MADLKISQLTSATLPLAGTEVLPIVQSSSTKKVATDDLTVKNVRSNATTGILQIAGPATAATRIMTVPDANFTAARTDAAQSFTGDQTLGTGNLIQGTAAKGINFTANTPAAGMTSELLNWYEEGAWTPSVGGDATYYVQEGYYTRVGRLVYIRAKIVINVLGTGSTTAISGLPFTSAASTYALADTINVNYYNSLAVNALAISGLINSSSTQILFNVSTAAGVTTTTAGAAVFGDAARLDFSGCYQAT